MSTPGRLLLWMVLGLVAVLGLAYLLWTQIYIAFLHNPALNSGIFVVLLIGIVYIFWQVIRLYREIAWIERLKRNDIGGSSGVEPILLAPMAAMMRERTGRLSLSAMALRSLLDSISARLDESRDISRYFIGLMVFLGLLGTFWGLLGTISGVAEAIGAISVAGASDVTQLFAQLKQGLGGPLAGMGTAFSASLFGLSGSLLLGYLELLAGQAQNRFFNELEEWLSERTRLTSSMAPGRRRCADPGLYPGAAGADRRQSGEPAAHRGPRRGKPDAGQYPDDRFARSHRRADGPAAGPGPAHGQAGREPGRDAARDRAPRRGDPGRPLRHRRAEPHPSAQPGQPAEPRPRRQSARPPDDGAGAARRSEEAGRGPGRSPAPAQPAERRA